MLISADQLATAVMNGDPRFEFLKAEWYKKTSKILATFKVEGEIHPRTILVPSGDHPLYDRLLHFVHDERTKH